MPLEWLVGTLPVLPYKRFRPCPASRVWDVGIVKRLSSTFGYGAETQRLLLFGSVACFGCCCLPEPESSTEQPSVLQAFNDMVVQAKKDAAQRAVQQASLAEAATAAAAHLSSTVLSSSMQAAAQHAIDAAEQYKRDQEAREAQEASAHVVAAAIQSVLEAVMQSNAQTSSHAGV